VIDEFLAHVRYNKKYSTPEKHPLVHYDIAKELIYSTDSLASIADKFNMPINDLRIKIKYICLVLGVEHGRTGLKTTYIEFLEDKLNKGE
jgi:hypothetical protein